MYITSDKRQKVYLTAFLPVNYSSYNIVVVLKTARNIVKKDRKMLYDNDEDIVFEYFELVKNNDIERLMNLFSPDAIVYEPFSKLSGGEAASRLLSLF